MSFDWEQAGEIIGLSLDEKVKMLEAIVQELLSIKIEYGQVSGRNAELKAQITVLSMVKSALQSSIRAEQAH